MTDRLYLGYIKDKNGDYTGPKNLYTNMDIAEFINSSEKDKLITDVFDLPAITTFGRFIDRFAPTVSGAERKAILNLSNFIMQKDTQALKAHIVGEKQMAVMNDTDREMEHTYPNYKTVCFEYEGQEITNPFYDETARFYMSLDEAYQHYGEENIDKFLKEAEKAYDEHPEIFKEDNKGKDQVEYDE